MFVVVEEAPYQALREGSWHQVTAPCYELIYLCDCVQAKHVVTQANKVRKL